MAAENWTVSKVINLGDIISIFVAMAALASVYATLSSRVAVLESGAARTAQDVAEIKQSLRELNGKLDQLIVREVSRDHPR